MEAYNQWRDWAEKACRRLLLSTSPSPGGTRLVRRGHGHADSNEHGVSTRFKHFMAYKNAIMCDDETLVNSFSRGLESSARLCTVHAENGELVFRACSRTHLRQGHHGPEGHPLSRPPEVEGEAANRAIRIAEVLGRAALPRPHLLHRRPGGHGHARASWRASGSSARCSPSTWSSTTRCTVTQDWDERGPLRDEPPFRSKEHQEALWRGCRPACSRRRRPTTAASARPRSAWASTTSARFRTEPAASKTA